MQKKLLLSFGSIIVLASIIVVFLLLAIRNVSSSVDSLYSGPYENVNEVWVLRRNLIDVQRAINRAMAEDETEFDDNAYQTFQSTIEKDVSEIKQSIALLETGIQNEDNQQRLADIIKIVNEGEQVRPQVMQLLKEKKFDEAYKLNYDTYMPIVSEINTMAVDLYNELTADAQEFVTHADKVSAWSLSFGIFLLLGSIIFSIVMMVQINNLVAKPIKEITEAAEEMQKGNMDAADMITYRSRDEVGVLADCMRITMQNLHAYVKEISEMLVQISGGDLTVDSNRITDFLGDFASIKESLVYILKSFNKTLTDINHTAAEVDDSSAQIADAAQNLASGSTEQAGTLEHLSSTITTISNQVNENADSAGQARNESIRTEEQVQACKDQMDRMLTAMQDINEASKEIGKIIKTIEDIAFQTNILALNAAVEAARAGAAGKGFAVVADEVRSLASKSADASRDTTQLIEKCVTAVNNGTILARGTAETLQSVVENVENVKNLIGHIAEQSEGQALAISQVRNGVEQVSSVVHTNSASAEESAATSKGLSEQAARLDQLVQRFKLYEGGQS